MVKFSAPNKSIENKFCSTGFVSIGDGNKCLASLFSIDTLKADDEDYDLIISDKNLKADIIPDYDMKNPSRNCYCSILDNLGELLEFDSQTIRVELDAPISSSSIFNNYILFDNSPGIFRLLDSEGNIYKVLGLLDGGGRGFWQNIDQYLRIYN